MSKTKEKDPAFLFYSLDFYEGTRMMLPEERACFIDLLIFQHQNGGSIPNDLRRLRLYCSGIDEATLQATLEAKFKLCDSGSYVNTKLQKVMEERSEFTGNQAVNGKVGQFFKKAKAILSAREFMKLQSFLNQKDKIVILELIKDKSISKAMLQAMLKHLEDEDVVENEIEDEVEIEDEITLERGAGKTFLENPFSPDFLSGHWQQWKQYKQGIKKPVKPESENIALKKLHKLSGGDEARACEIIEESIAQGWVGLYLPKESQQHTNHKPESPTQTDDITRIIDEFNALTKSDYNAADEAIRGYLAGRLMDGCQLQDMLDVITLKAVQWGSGDSRKYLKFHILFKPEKYPGYVQEVKDAKSGKIKVINPNESAYDRIQRKIDAALGRTQSA